MENPIENNTTNVNVETKSNGALVGSVIIIVILIIGGIYLVKSNVERARQQQQMIEQQQAAQEEANKLSESDDVTDIEADLNANGDIDGLDQGLE